MAASAYRLPYRYRRLARRKSSSREALIAAAVFVALAAAGGKAATAVHTGTASQGRAVPVAGPGESAFFGAVLADLGAPDTAADVTSLESWYPHEYPSWPPGADYNPLDTILPEPGSWAFNTFDGDLHVQSYPSASEGAQATADTLAGSFPLIAAALRTGGGLCGNPSLAAEFLRWSGDAYPGVC